MTEDEWRTSPAPAAMLAWLESRMEASRRKLRLFLCGCCRLLWNDILPPVRKAVEVAELASDREPSLPFPLQTVSRLHDALLSAHARLLSDADQEVTAVSQWLIFAHSKPGDWAEHASLLCPPGRAPAQAELLRELFGNPFRKVRRVGSRLHARVATWPDNRRPADLLFVRDWLSWHDGTIIGLARAIHEEQAFDRMPILADALEDAGCMDEAILEHCRSPQAHARGCWVIDLILGRE